MMRPTSRPEVNKKAMKTRRGEASLPVSLSPGTRSRSTADVARLTAIAMVRMVFIAAVYSFPGSAVRFVADQTVLLLLWLHRLYNCAADVPIDLPVNFRNAREDRILKARFTEYS